MTPGEAAGRHLDDLDLTDLVDGRASDWSAEHAASCADCRRQLARLREVRRMVGALAGAVPDDAGTRRAQAVAAALGEERPKTLLARIGPRPPWWAAAAAAAAIALGGSLAGLEMAGGLRGGGGSHSIVGSAASRSTATSGSGPIGAGSAGASGPVGSSGAAGSAAAAAPPLGSVAGPQQLVEDLKSRLAAVPAASAAQGAAAGSAAAVPSSSSENRGATGGYASSPAAVPPPAAAPEGLSCLATADALELLGPARTLLLQATLVYGVTPAQVFVFGAQSQHMAVVMRPATCQTVATVSF